VSKLRTLVALGAVSMTVLAATPAHAAATCDAYVGPSGSDSAAGTLASPYATVQHLSDTLTPGQTGCLLAGTYVENLRLVNPGITLTSAPGVRATVRGRMRLMEAATDVTITRLNIDGRNTQGSGSPVVVADRATFTYDDVTNYNTDICFIVGAIGWSGWPDEVIHDMTIAHNRIHNCGVLPSTNTHHGLYIENTDRLQIVDNVIYDNAARGIQLYPNAVNTTVSGNIIDGNGEGLIFGGDNGVSSNHNLVTRNIITNSKLRSGVESWYPQGTAPGVANVVTVNCLSGNAGGDVNTSAGGFQAVGNVTADPGYADAGAKDFTVAASSPCAPVLAGANPPTTAAALDDPSATGIGPVVATPAPPAPPVTPPVTQVVVSNTTATQSTAQTAVISTWVTVSTPTASAAATVLPTIATSHAGHWQPVKPKVKSVRHTSRTKTRHMTVRVRVARGTHMIRLRLQVDGHTVLKRVVVHHRHAAHHKAG
jgi:parallel beta-helix repeat protein